MLAQLPKLDLVEMGPSCDLVLRRHREAPPDVRREAYSQAKGPKKKKNVRSDEIDGKVGRIYIPSQDVDEVALFKPKGVKRQRREAAAAAKEALQDAPEVRRSLSREEAASAQESVRVHLDGELELARPHLTSSRPQGTTKRRKKAVEGA